MPAAVLRVASADASLAARLAGPQGLVPGAAQELNSGALIVYEGASVDADDPDATLYAFRLEFGTPNVAAVAANWLWSQLHGHAVTLEVGGAEVPLHHAAIKAALLEAAGEPQPV